MDEVSWVVSDTKKNKENKLASPLRSVTRSVTIWRRMAHADIRPQCPLSHLVLIIIQEVR